MFRSTVRAAVAVAAAAVVVPLFVAGPAAATTYGTTTGTYCGAGGTFKTVNDIPQVKLIVDANGRADSTHNGGCFGITPNGHIYWTPRISPRWRAMPGNGIAVRVYKSYLGHACPPQPYTCPGSAGQTVAVQTGSGAVYGQTWDSFTGGWEGHWYRT